MLPPRISLLSSPEKEGMTRVSTDVSYRVRRSSLFDLFEYWIWIRTGSAATRGFSSDEKPNSFFLRFIFLRSSLVFVVFVHPRRRTSLLVSPLGQKSKDVSQSKASKCRNVLRPEIGIGMDRGSGIRYFSHSAEKIAGLANSRKATQRRIPRRRWGWRRSPEALSFSRHGRMPIKSRAWKESPIDRRRLSLFLPSQPTTAPVPLSLAYSDSLSLSRRGWEGAGGRGEGEGSEAAGAEGLPKLGSGNYGQD